MWKLSLTAGMVLLALQTSAVAENPALDAFPPVVVQTSPTAGDQGVDPAVREIRVTFSEEMMTHEMWSFVYAKPAAFPKIAGKVRYLEDKRTCVLPVSLEPGQTYGIWINSQEHTSFRDTHQNPAVPYLLTFKTRN
jgi:hypothetical protein